MADWQLLLISIKSSNWISQLDILPSGIPAWPGVEMIIYLLKPGYRDREGITNTERAVIA